MMETSVTVIAQNIESGLVAFEKRKAELIGLKTQSDGLSITSVEDVKQIEEVSSIRKKLKFARVAIEKEGKAMRDPLTQISKNISSREKELIEIIEPTEKKLLSQEKWVEQEKENVRIRMERIKSLPGRKERLEMVGHSITDLEIVEMDDVSFDQLIGKIYEEKQAEQLRLKQQEEDRERRAEEERLRAENEKLQEEKRLIEEKSAKDRKELEDRMIQEKKKLEDAAEKEFQERMRLQRAEDDRIRIQKEVEDAKKQEDERLAMAPDKEQLREWIRNTRIGFTPANLGASAHKKALDIHSKFSSFIEWANKEIDKL